MPAVIRGATRSGQLPARGSLRKADCAPNTSATCFDLPPDDIDSFHVTIGTGGDGTDADIFFCVEQRDAAGEECRILDNALIDDFEPESVDDFNIYIAVVAGQLDRIFIDNRAGAIFGNNDWHIAALTVDAISASGSTRIYDEPQINCGRAVDRGQQYHAGICDW